MPGDYLPPQPLLEPTKRRGTGFRVGPLPGDVCLDLPIRSGHVLLFGPVGLLDTLTNDDTVTVIRADY